MTTKAKEAIELSDTQYDAGTGQSIPLTLTQGDKSFDVRHSLNALTDERYYKFLEQQESVEKTATKKAEITTAIHSPKIDLWNDLATSVEGYKTKDDFKESVHFTHKKEAIDGLLEVQFPDQDAAKADEGWDIDAFITVPFQAMFSGSLITNLSHSFRPESKAEMDEFLAMEFNQPDKNKMASAKRSPIQERLAELGRRLLKETTGYVPGSEVPSWHLAATTERFFLLQIAQAGKSSA